LAEDNDVNALIAKTMLKNIGASFEHVTNGIEAIERMQRTDLIRPDIILMDCQMPRLDGFEATLRLRSIEEKNNFPRTPIIAITASAMAEDNMKCIQSGMDAYLSKPFSEKQLLAFIKNFTDKSI
jgi:two-component system, sensor histidine kinase